MPRPEDMRQSRLMSLVEAVANVAVGYVVALATQLLVFPIFGLSTRLAADAGLEASTSRRSRKPAAA